MTFVDDLSYSAVLVTPHFQGFSTALIKAHSSTAHRSTPMHHKTCKTIIKQKQ